MRRSASLCPGIKPLFTRGGPLAQDASAIVLYEEHVRFMILAEHELSGYAGDNFNSHLNLEQINKARFQAYEDLLSGLSTAMLHRAS